MLSLLLTTFIAVADIHKQCIARMTNHFSHTEVNVAEQATLSRFSNRLLLVLKKC